ncbi:MAG: nitronate monooxygenase [Bacteroidales bacterium]|jgi:enoyl-[acyl-carrier protein] reductase II|nr:nitronate monooxygenase [Bacteroidales bacterium]MCI2122524.1 nitronate monooxygenase [Bacteroidales bacterium]MCI2145285.1 nitronate monooxygenase [Bacteroidales bacterium]
MKISESPLCTLLGIKYPIIQGGMAWVADASLAAAVSNAGGLGLISCINAGSEAVRNEIIKCRQLTDKPFGVNIMLMAPNADEIAQMVINEHVGIVTTGAGMPTRYMAKWLDAGIKVIPVISASLFAMKAESIGACALVAEGGESGGHIGEMNTMALVPAVVDAVHIPVIAAGGIADGRGMAAAFMLGAAGVQCGTCFLVADECNVSDIYKDKVISARDSDTIVTGRSLGHPVRALKTPFTRKFAEMERDKSIKSEDIMAFGTGSLRKAVREGDIPGGSFMAGESAGLVHKRQSTAAIIEEMLGQAKKLMKDE